MVGAIRQPLHALIIEDSPLDAELVVRELERAGFDLTWQRVASERDCLAALRPTLDVILSDFKMPQFSALRALELLKDRALDIPFIVVSGSIEEETAVQALKSGATDYLLKDRLARLGQAVQRARHERILREAKRSAEQALVAAEERTRFALEASGVGTWDIDITTGTARWSETLEALHGVPAGGFGGTVSAFLELVHPDDRQLVSAKFEPAVHEATALQLLYRTRWPDASVHWISIMGRRFCDDHGTLVRAAGVGLDVTQRHALDEHHRDGQKTETIGRLAGGIGHDFTSLLTVIAGYSALIADEMGPDFHCRSELNEVRCAAERAASLTRQLLASSVDAAIEAPSTPAVVGSLHGSETILVVEDEKGVRELIRRILERYGYRVLTASTPEQAMAIANTEAGSIQLLLSNIVLPQMSGSDLSARLVPGRRGMRVLYMSGYTDDLVVDRGVLREGTAFLQKPFTPAGLASKIREMLGPALIEDSPRLKERRDG